ncbi:MAG: hypothetical protein K0S08_2122 [Gammaproteobacteria bacterium]|nr:hypothetical protein [Gammaproteobacteria bacterium]
MKTLNYKLTLTQGSDLPCWIKMINEIHEVLGFSWARIASRIGSSSSSIQKLVKDFNRIPRDKMFVNLACYYYKLFYSEFSLPKAKKYIAETNDKTLYNVTIELLHRGFFDDQSQTLIKEEYKKIYFDIAQKKGIISLKKQEDTPAIFNKSIATLYPDFK